MELLFLLWSIKYFRDYYHIRIWTNSHYNNFCSLKWNNIYKNLLKRLFCFHAPWNDFGMSWRKIQRENREMINPSCAASVRKSRWMKQNWVFDRNISSFFLLPSHLHFYHCTVHIPMYFEKYNQVRNIIKLWILLFFMNTSLKYSFGFSLSLNPLI